MTKHTLRILVFVFAILPSISNAALKYQPFDGHGGYQEIKISENLYYVGFHGNRDDSYDEISSAWAARSAQLCSQSGAAFFVELAYFFEPLTKGELDIFSNIEPEPRFMHTAGYVYIPMYIPSGPRITKIDAPSKLAAVRCLQSTENMIDSKRAISVTEKLQEASRMKIGVK